MREHCSHTCALALAAAFDDKRTIVQLRDALGNGKTYALPAGRERLSRCLYFPENGGQLIGRNARAVIVNADYKVFARPQQRDGDPAAAAAACYAV